MAPHAFAHCDSTNAFKGIWRVKFIRTMQTNQILQPVLARLGETGEVANYVLAGFEVFTNVYLKMASSTADKNVDFSSLPSCQKTFVQHMRRANYQMIICRNADTAVVGVHSVVDGHGWTLKDGVITPLWFEGDCLTTIMVEESLLEEERSYMIDVEEKVDEMCL